MGGIGGGGADSLGGIQAPSALQMPRCTKPEPVDPSKASDLVGGETEAQGGEGAAKGTLWSVLSRSQDTSVCCVALTLSSLLDASVLLLQLTQTHAGRPYESQEVKWGFQSPKKSRDYTLMPKKQPVHQTSVSHSCSH